MKELDIEEKAKRYDEALARAKEMIKAMTNIGGVAKVDDIQYLFPELKESEDERIKNIIKKSLRVYFEGNLAIGTNDTDYAECLAWLENQGKNNMGISEATKKKLEDSLNKALEKETPESWNKFLDEQSEQKPWSEEDEETLKDIITSMTNLKDSATSDALRDIYNSKIDWLKSLKDRIQPQPKQEWSEEDEKCIRLSTDIIDSSLRAGFCVQLDRDRCVDWLKSLRPQNTWKPSEEDEEHVNSLLKRLKGLCRKEFATTRFAISEDEDWLKSLRPQSTWKPSDEQMCVIEAVINNRSFQRRHLDSLYADLKKLRKE